MKYKIVTGECQRIFAIYSRRFPFTRWKYRGMEYTMEDARKRLEKIRMVDVPEHIAWCGK